MLPVLKESSKGGKKRNNISYLKNKYKEISQMLGESKIKKKKMLGGRLGLGGGWGSQKAWQKISICLLGCQRVRSLCYKIASLPRPPALQTQQRTMSPLTFSSVALPLLPGRWSGNKREFPTLRKASSTLAGRPLSRAPSSELRFLWTLTAFPTDDRPYSRSRSSSRSSSREPGKS